jgi:hypothetical protein
MMICVQDPSISQSKWALSAAEKNTKLRFSACSRLRMRLGRRRLFSVCHSNILFCQLYTLVITEMLTIDSGSNGVDAQRRAQQGFDLVSINTDVGVLGAGMVQELSVASGQAADAKPREGY